MMTLTASAESSAPRKGEILAAKYEVEEVLGAGGMGVVVAARHIALRQRVAMKFLLPRAFLLPGATERFLREARACVAIKGEHVARVLDVGTLETGAPYMVMEHLEGADLRATLRARASFGVEEAVDLFLQVCEAVAEAHALGIIHRDLKPANVFLTRRPDGRPLVKVLDFGLSKVISGDGADVDENLTETGFAAGSPSYASPEQLRDLKQVDARADIWALGVILFEMLVKQRPFAGTSMTAVAVSIATDTAPSLTALRPEVAPGIDAIVQRCLQKDPSVRPAHVAEIAAALAPFASAYGAASVDSILRLAPASALAALSLAPAPQGTEMRAGPGSGPQGAARPSVSSPADPALAGSDAHDPSTLARSAWSETAVRRKKKSRALIAAAAATLALAVGIGVSIARFGGSAAPAPDPAAGGDVSARAAAASSTAAPSSAVIVAPAPASSLVPSPSVSGAASSPAASPSSSQTAHSQDAPKTGAATPTGAKAGSGGPAKKKGDLLDRWQ